MNYYSIQNHILYDDYIDILPTNTITKHTNNNHTQIYSPYYYIIKIWQTVYPNSTYTSYPSTIPLCNCCRRVIHNTSCLYCLKFHKCCSYVLHKKTMNGFMYILTIQ